MRATSKAGCTTLAHALIRHSTGKGFDGDPHVKGEAPFDWGPTTLPTFHRSDLHGITSVRNPYERILSAYLDKVVCYPHHLHGNGVMEFHCYRGGDRRYTRLRDCFQFGSRYEDRQVEEFERFILALGLVYLEGKFPPLRDRHFDPYDQPISQFREMVVSRGGKFSVLRMESFNEDLARVLPGGVDPEKPTVANKGSVKKARPLGEFFASKKVVETIQAIYEKDFLNWNYSPEPPNPTPYPIFPDKNESNPQKVKP